MLLPFTLISFILSSVTSGSPVETESTSFQLTTDSFKSTTSSGTWFVEFFSPFCGHCRHFAPTWFEVEDLVKKEAADGKGSTVGVRLAQVNCITSGDLCRSENVKGYPTLRIYKDGQKGPEFDDDRDKDKILKFIASHAPLPPPPPATSSPSSTATSTSSSPTSTDASQDAPPPIHVQTSRSNPNVNIDGTVLSLNPTNFLGTVSTSEAVFIKFYAPWCGHCKKLAPIWTQLAQKMKQKMTVAEVNCEAYPKLCTEEGVEGFPMLYLYRGGQKLDYAGGRDLKAMESFSEKALEPAVMKIDPAKTTSEILQDEEVVFVFVHLTVDHHALSLVNDVGNKMLSNPPVKIVTTTSPSLRSQFQQTTPGPGLFVLKTHKGIKPDPSIRPQASFVFKPATTGKEIQSFIEANRFPLVTELTSDTFQSIMPSKKSPFKPLVLIWATLPSNVPSGLNTLRLAEAQWREGIKDQEHRPILWVHMDAEKWGSWLKSMYGIKKDKLPAFIIADHTKLKFYDRLKSGKKFEATSEGLVEAADAASRGLLSSRHSNNIFERMAKSISSGVQSFADLFVVYPIRMVLLMVALVCLLIWFLSSVITEDNGGGRSGPGGGGTNGYGQNKLRLGEKSRRLD